MKPNVLRTSRSSAFSLVEIALALGLFSFCLVGILGLLPVGLNNVKILREESAAVKTLEHITYAIRGGTLRSGTFQAGGDFSDIVWEEGNGLNLTISDLSLSGLRTPSEIDQRMTATIEILPQSNPDMPVNALVSVAWPSNAQWNSTKASWDNAEGSLSTWMIFLPPR